MSGHFAPAALLLALPDPVRPTEPPPALVAPTLRSPASVVLALPDPMAVPAAPLAGAAGGRRAPRAQGARRVVRRARPVA